MRASKVPSSTLKHASSAAGKGRACIWHPAPPLTAPPSDATTATALTLCPRAAPQGLEPWVAQNVEPMLLDTRRAWQPSDYLPDPAQPDFLDRVRAFQAECAQVPPELMVVLVGDMVTEEALPSYLSMLNRMDATKDESGAARARARALALAGVRALALCVRARSGGATC